MAVEAKKFMDDSVALIDTAKDLKSSRTGKDCDLYRWFSQCADFLLSYRKSQGKV